MQDTVKVENIFHASLFIKCPTAGQQIWVYTKTDILTREVLEVKKVKSIAAKSVAECIVLAIDPESTICGAVILESKGTSEDTKSGDVLLLYHREDLHFKLLKYGLHVPLAQELKLKELRTP